MVLWDFDVSYAMYKVLMVIKGSTLACDVIYGIYKLLSQCVGRYTESTLPPRPGVSC